METRRIRGRTVVLIAVPGLLALVAAGWAVQQIYFTDHEHYAFRVFVGDEEILWDHPRFDFQNTKDVRAHLHGTGRESVPLKYILHAEGKLPIDLAYFFGTLGVEFQDDHVRLNPDVQQGRRIDNNATHEWQLWVDGCRDGAGDWLREVAFAHYEPRHHDRMLIVYAARDADVTSLSARMAAVPTAAEMAAQLHEDC